VAGEGTRRRLRVAQTTLDAFVERSGEAPDWVKLDVEGAEPRALAGATRTLRRSRPHIIFECWPGPAREALARAFAAEGYRVCALPWDARGEPRALASRAFAESSKTNFLAQPSSS
jgi:hypothetical protein